MKNKSLIPFILFILLCASSWAQAFDYSKMSAMVADQLQTARRAKSLKTTDSRPVSSAILSLVKLQDKGMEDALTSRGCKIIDNIGNIYITVVPVVSIADLVLDPRVLRIESNPTNELHTDSTAQTSNALPIYKGEGLPQAYTGSGVIVGITDNGFDFTHPMFLDADGHSRIRQAWDIFTGKGEGYKSIGSLYTSEDEIMNAKGMNYTDAFHGTHVMGIAAGSPVIDGKYRGIAYEADILACQALLGSSTDVQSRNLIDDINRSIREGTADGIWDYVISNQLSLSDAMDVLFLKYLFDYADAVGKPCVVNCSFGQQMGLTEDYTLRNELISALTGPGKIMVASTGNNSDTDIYRQKEQDETLDTPLWFWASQSMNPMFQLRSDQPFTITLRPDIDGCPAYTLSSEAIPFSGSGNILSDSIIIDAADNKYGISEALKYQMSDGTISYSISIGLPETKKNHYNSASIDFKVEGNGVVRVMGQYDCLGFTRFSSLPVSSNYTVSFPAILNDAIAVGAMSYREKVTNINGDETEATYNKNAYGRIVSWSGTGPTLDGAMKPDIAAAGYNVVSAFNSLMPEESYYSDGKLLDRIITGFQHDGKEYYMYMSSGTSQAAPVVTGIIALWLQADPTLTPARIKEIFAQTAAHPETDTYPNYRYGYGAIDAYKGLCYILNIPDNIDEFSDHQPEGVNISLQGDILILGGITKASVKIYTIGGQLMRNVETTDGTVSLAGLPAAVYAIQINTDSPSTTGSTLVRLK